MDGLGQEQWDFHRVSVVAWSNARSHGEVALFADLNAALHYPELTNSSAWAVKNDDLVAARAILVTLVWSVMVEARSIRNELSD